LRNCSLLRLLIFLVIGGLGLHPVFEKHRLPNDDHQEGERENDKQPAFTAGFLLGITNLGQRFLPFHLAASWAAFEIL
jgi:hypothetical protein